MKLNFFLMMMLVFLIIVKEKNDIFQGSFTANQMKIHKNGTKVGRSQLEYGIKNQFLLRKKSCFKHLFHPAMIFNLQCKFQKKMDIFVEEGWVDIFYNTK